MLNMNCDSFCLTLYFQSLKVVKQIFAYKNMHILNRYICWFCSSNFLLSLPFPTTSTCLCSLDNGGCVTFLEGSSHDLWQWRPTWTFFKGDMQKVIPFSSPHLEGVELVEHKSALGHFCLDISVILFEVILIPRLFLVIWKSVPSFQLETLFSSRDI